MTQQSYQRPDSRSSRLAACWPVIASESSQTKPHARRTFRGFPLPGLLPPLLRAVRSLRLSHSCSVARPSPVAGELIVYFLVVTGVLLDGVTLLPRSWITVARFCQAFCRSSQRTALCCNLTYSGFHRTDSRWPGEQVTYTPFAIVECPTTQGFRSTALIITAHPRLPSPERRTSDPCHNPYNAVHR